MKAKGKLRVRLISEELIGADNNENYGSNVNEELRDVREDARNFLRRKRRKEAEDGFIEVPLGEVGYCLQVMKGILRTLW
ncbi:conserved hypothetical protein [Ricinus communis]|uniref:Uncharacterized protein n=1 Tax=Ricinus communis TaxID=3988 RepID=B9T6U8_RICCO|nr:conserved hypothetical protein [Ricinus communis]